MLLVILQWSVYGVNVVNVQANVANKEKMVSHNDIVTTVPTA